MAIHEHIKKRIATEHAKELRSQGYKASVHKTKAGWMVYSYRDE